MMAQSNVKFSKPGERVSKKPKLSNERQKNIMKMIKEFSKKSVDTEDKISLTFNTKSGCQLLLEKSNGEIENLLDFGSENGDHCTGLSSNKIDTLESDPKKGSTSLLGGHKKKSKSQEREAQQRKRAAKLNNLSKDDIMQKQADERARKKLRRCLLKS